MKRLKENRRISHRTFIVVCLIFFAQLSPLLAQEDILKELKIDEDQYLKYKYYYFEGNKQKMLGNYPEAVQQFMKCCEIVPQSASSNYELANLYFLQGDYVTALDFSKLAVKLNGSNIYYEMQLAKLYEQNNMLSESATVYKSIVKKYPDRPQIHIEYAILLSSLGKNKAAIKELNKLELKTGITEIVSLEKERIYTQMEMPEKAIDELLKLINAFPLEARNYGMLAESYISINQNDKALESYLKVLEVEPENGRVRLALAEFYRMTGESEKSFDQLKLAYGSQNVDLDFKIKTLLNIFTVKFPDAETKKQADELLMILLETHPDDSKVHTLYADFLIDSGEIEKARDQLRIVIKEEKERFLIWEQLILLEGDLKDYNGMYEESKEAIEYFPNQPNIYLFNGIAATRLKKYNDAIESFSTGVELVIDNVEQKMQFYANLAEAYDKINNHQKSDSIFDLILLEQPDNRLVLNNYSYYLAMRGEKLEKAEEMGKRCIELDPFNSTYLDTYAWALYKRAKHAEALKIIEKSLENGGSDNPVILEHYGDILYKSGESEKAVEQWKRALDKGKGTELLEEKIKKGTLVE